MLRANVLLKIYCLLRFPSSFSTSMCCLYHPPVEVFVLLRPEKLKAKKIYVKHFPAKAHRTRCWETNCFLALQIFMKENFVFVKNSFEKSATSQEKKKIMKMYSSMKTLSFLIIRAFFVYFGSLTLLVHHLFLARWLPSVKFSLWKKF